MFSIKLAYRKVPELKVLIKRDVHKGYYDLLGLTPKATQTDIKNAYYKMSMMYHPDKEDGNPARFREISTAYEILGNRKLRKMYDSGMLPLGPLTELQKKRAEDDADKMNLKQKARDQAAAARQSRSNPKPNEAFYENISGAAAEEHRKKRRTGPTFTGKSEHFDFDAWTKAHYSETFTRGTRARFRAKLEETTVSERFRRIDTAVSLTFIFAVFYLGWYATSLSTSDISHVKPPKDDR